MANGSPSAGRRGNSPWAERSDTCWLDATLNDLPLMAVVAPTRKRSADGRLCAAVAGRLHLARFGGGQGQGFVPKNYPPEAARGQAPAGAAQGVAGAGFGGQGVFLLLAFEIPDEHIAPRSGGEVAAVRVEGDRAVLARTPNFLDLAGSIRVPAAKRNVAWDEVLRRTRADRAATRR